MSSEHSISKNDVKVKFTCVNFEVLIIDVYEDKRFLNDMFLNRNEVMDLIIHLKNGLDISNDCLLIRECEK